MKTTHKLALVNYGNGFTDWLLVLHPSDMEGIMAEHGRITLDMFLKECRDSHLCKAVAEGLYPSAISLASKWFIFVASFGRSVLVNSKGGWMPLDGAIIIEERYGQWPDESPSSRQITITRWQDGSHFYVEGADQKFNSSKEAITWARKSSPGCRVKEVIRSL
jgi:hypothetical protein